MSNLYTHSLHLAREYHKKQVRKVRGNPYFEHLCNVAEHVAYMNGSEAHICAGLLHDILEDTTMDALTLHNELSKYGDILQVDEIIQIVQAMTQNKSLGHNDRITNQLDNVFKAGRGAMLVLMSDYLDNVSDLVKDQREFGKNLWYKFNIKPEMKFKAIQRVHKFLKRYLITNRTEIDALERLYNLLKTEYKKLK